MRIEFNSEDLEPIVEMVRRAAPFVITPSTIVDPYDLKEYIIASAAETCKLYAILDNNIITRACSIADGQAARTGSNNTEALRLTAAIMCFFILGGFHLEPSLAIYEKASKADHPTGMRAFELFRIADHIHPQLYADLALGRIERIPEADLSLATILSKENKPDITVSDFSRQIAPWQVQYLALLKAASIWREGESTLNAAISYIRWMETDSFFNVAGAIFALAFFGPNRPSKMLKGNLSTPPDQLIVSVQNAAWDMTYVSQWAKKASKAKRDEITFLCSNDRIVKAMARPILIPTGADQDAELGAFLRQYWSALDTGKLVSELNRAIKIVTASPVQRRREFELRYSHMPTTIKGLEDCLLIR